MISLLKVISNFTELLFAELDTELSLNHGFDLINGDKTILVGISCIEHLNDHVTVSVGELGEEVICFRRSIGLFS